MSEKYIPVPIEKGGSILLQCCDCGLVHRMGLKVRDDGTLGLTLERLERNTAAIRRQKTPCLFHPRKADRWKIVRKRRKR